MIRLIGILVGLGFTAAVVWAFGWGAYTQITEPAEETVDDVMAVLERRN